jgi:nitrous oxidase accessory protein
VNARTRNPKLRLAALFASCATAALAAASPPAATRPADEIAAMIERAGPGATVVIPPGVYTGQLRVRKPVTLDGGGRVTIDGGGTGTVVEVTAPGVTIRGLSIRGSGEDVMGEPAGLLVLAGDAVIEDNTLDDTLYGIDLREATGSIIRRNSIRGKDLDQGRRGDGIRLWWSHSCLIESNTVIRSRDMVFWYSEDLRVEGNRVTGSRYGLHFMYSHDTVLERNELTANSVGVYLMYSNRIRLVHNHMGNNRGASGYGVGLKDCDDITIERNAMLANRVGVYIDNSPSSFDSTGLFASNMIAFNEIGLLATPNTHDNVFTGNAFVENEQQAATHGRGALDSNAFARAGVGNFWSDYAGFDLDGDGVGDLPYEPRSLFGAMLADTPNLRLFVHSPAQQAIEFTARALPELRPRPTLNDPSPLAAPPRIGTAAGAGASSPAGMALGGFLLLAVGVSLIGALGREPRLHPGRRRATA